MTPLATVSVIIPSDNRCAVIRTTIKRLVAQDYPAERMEILVVDSSRDETPAMVEVLARDSAVPVRLLSSDAWVPAIKRNHGLRAAVGDLVVFLDEEVWVGPDFVATHVAAHAQFAEPVAVLGHVGQSPQGSAAPFAEWYQPFPYQELPHLAGQPVPWQYSSSRNLSMPRQFMLDRNLLFHEDEAEIGHEDLELGYRWCKAGHQIIYVPAAHGENHGSHDLASACRRQTAVGRAVRDLEALVPDPGLPARFGIVTSDASFREHARMAARRALFNAATAPPLERALPRLPRRNRVAEWCYRQLLLRHTRLGYHAPRTPAPDGRTQHHSWDDAAAALEPVNA
jgi:GT2 family glycosyltransferase